VPERRAAGPCYQNVAKANIHDRRSIERVYPLDAFARDAAENDRPDAGLLHGVRIGSAPDRAGDFEVEPASRHAGEVPGAVFLAPFHRATANEHAPADPDPHHGYQAFVGEIIDAAQQFGYRAETSPGPGDPRLKGARQ
jgi:hypothetical protein